MIWQFFDMVRLVYGVVDWLLVKVIQLALMAALVYWFLWPWLKVLASFGTHGQ